MTRQHRVHQFDLSREYSQAQCTTAQAREAIIAKFFDVSSEDATNLPKEGELGQPFPDTLSPTLDNETGPLSSLSPLPHRGLVLQTKCHNTNYKPGNHYNGKKKIKNHYIFMQLKLPQCTTPRVLWSIRHYGYPGNWCSLDTSENPSAFSGKWCEYSHFGCEVAREEKKERKKYCLQLFFGTHWEHAVNSIWGS